MQANFARPESIEHTLQTLSSLLNMLTFALTESTPVAVHRKKIRLPPRKTIRKKK